MWAVFYQSPGSLRVLCSILAVARTAVFRTKISDDAPGTFWSFSPILGLQPSVP